MHHRSAHVFPAILAFAVLFPSAGGAVPTETSSSGSLSDEENARTGKRSEEEIARTAKVEEAEVHLVLIDAVVQGKDGQPLRGLRREDFTLQVDGRNAAIGSFEDYCPEPRPFRETVPAAPAPVPVQGAGAPEAAGAAATGPAQGARAAAGATAGQPSARVVLYFDLPHLSPHGAARSVSAARRFLESSTDPGALYTVVAYGRTVKILAPFTSDRSRVLAALGEVLEIGGPYDEGPFSRVHKVQQVTHETCPRRTEERRGGGLGSTCSNQVLAAKLFAQQEEALARRSLAAVKALLVALSGLEGRKALVFFTETMKDEPGVHYLEIARTTPRGEGIDINLEFRSAVEEASAAAVAFYPVYAAGLDDQSDMQLLRSQSGLGGAGTISGSVTRALSNLLDRDAVEMMTPTRSNEGASLLQEDIGPIEQAFRTAEAASLGFNASVAAETGGRHLGRTNDLSLVFPLVAEDMSCYYVIGYVDPPPHDGGRHMVRLDVGVKGARVRSRTFYMDWTPGERHERRFRTALAAPGAFRDFDVQVHVFPFGRSAEGRRILLVSDVPVSALGASAAKMPPGDGAAVVDLRGRVAAEGAEVCAFATEFTLPDAVGEAAGGRTLHVESACDLAPGRYEVVTAVAERRGDAMAAARREVEVPAATGFHVTEPQLWAASGGDIVEASKAGSIMGAAQGVVVGAASPRAERRLKPGERGTILFLVCPEEAGSGEKGALPAGPVTVTRTILSGDEPVATFSPLSLEGPPDGSSGCWAVSSPLPEKVFGDGVYWLDYEVSAPALAEPFRGRAAFEVTTFGS